jgi:hypothetical protein
MAIYYQHRCFVMYRSRSGGADRPGTRDCPRWRVVLSQTKTEGSDTLLTYIEGGCFAGLFGNTTRANEAANRSLPRQLFQGGRVHGGVQAPGLPNLAAHLPKPD